MPEIQQPTNPESERPGIFGWFGLTISTLLLLLGILILAGWIGGDTRDWSMWLSWVPAPVACALAFLGILLVGTVRGHLAAFVRVGQILLMLFFLSWTFGTDLGLFRSRPVDTSDFVLVHWNATWPGKGMDLPMAYRAIESTDADMVVVTEPGTFGWGPEGKAFVAGWPHVIRATGLVILSRQPLLQVTPILDAEKVSLVLARVDIDDVDRSIWIVDLPSDPRRSRKEVFKALLDGAEVKGLGAPDIVVGDFNVTRHSRALESAFPGYQNAFDEAGSGWSGTWPRTWPLWQIDQVLVGPGLTARLYEVIDPGTGHHRMQRVVLRQVPELPLAANPGS
jgi:endonuclease/exonuclease/phosphatase (EEP) superfamily protein YafD